MKKAVIGILIGYAVWTALWLGGNVGLSAAFPDQAAAFTGGEPITGTSYLAIALVLSVVCSFLAGLTNAALAGTQSKGPVLTMAGLLLITGIAVQAGVWSLMPVWYHSVFLLLLVPVCLIGGRGKRGQ